MCYVCGPYMSIFTIILTLKQAWFTSGAYTHWLKWITAQYLFLFCNHCEISCNRCKFWCFFIVAERVLPGIFIFLDKLLSKEHISDELEALRERYVALLQCTTTESPLVVRKNVESLADSLSLKYEASNKTGKFGRIREKRLINIRQVCFKYPFSYA